MLLDTNIIGTFAVIGELELLVALFGREEIGIVPAVHTEILQGIREGRGFLQAAVDLLHSTKVIPSSIKVLHERPTRI